MRYQGSINDSIRYYREVQDNVVKQGIFATKATTWYIGKLPEGIRFEEKTRIPLSQLDIISPTMGVGTLERLERIVAEAALSSKPSSEQTQLQQ